MSKKIELKNVEKLEMILLFNIGKTLKEIGKVFNCSGTSVGRILISEMDTNEYKRIAKERQKENGQKAFQKLGKLPKTEKQIETCRENGRNSRKKWNAKHPEEHKKNGRKAGLKYGLENLKKAWKLPRTLLQIETCRENGRKTGSINITKYNESEKGRENTKKLHESNAKNHNFISRPEAIFYITHLSKNFWLKDIVPQYFIKEIKHRVDFAVPSQNLLFEVDGDYYHGHSGDPEMDKERLERDAEVDKWAKDNGWTIFRYNDEKMKKLGIIK